MPDLRSIDLTRTETGRYLATNNRGTTLAIGHGQNDDFTPVELLLVALAGCAAVDVDLITGRRAQPTRFDVTATGDKVRDPSGGTRLDDLTVTFTVQFPDGPAGDAAREMLPTAIAMTADRLCTVARTVQRGTPVAMSTAQKG